MDLGLVEQAAGALDAGDLVRTRDLLQSAVGAGPYVGTAAGSSSEDDAKRVRRSVSKTKGEPA